MAIGTWTGCLIVIKGETTHTSNFQAGLQCGHQFWCKPPLSFTVAVVGLQAIMAYSHVEKLDRKTGTFTPYGPLRAVGLAYELGHKLVAQRGCQMEFCRKGVS